MQKIVRKKQHFAAKRFRASKRLAAVCLTLAMLCLFGCEQAVQTVPIPAEAPQLQTDAPTPDLSGAHAAQSAQSLTETPAPTVTPYVPQKLIVRFVGDLMTSKPMIESAKLADGSYSFDSIFDPIRPELQGADLMIGNLETPIAGEENEGFTGHPRFNAPDAYLEAVQAAGFNVVTNANNHLLDRGVEGALTTIRKIRALGLMHTGSFLSPEDAKTLLIPEVRGVKVAVLAYSYRSTRKEKPKDKETLQWLPNFNNPEKMAADIQKARALGADVVLVFTHMGKEGTHEPTRFQREMAQHLVDCGVDAAIFCHSHAVQPFDRLTAPDGREIFVAYALGNFLADGEYNMSRSGMVLELPITVDTQSGSVSVDDVRYVPTYSHQEKGQDGLTLFSLYAAGKAMEDASLPDKTRRLAALAWETVTEVAGEEYAKPVASFAS